MNSIFYLGILLLMSPRLFSQNLDEINMSSPTTDDNTIRNYNKEWVKPDPGYPKIMEKNWNDFKEGLKFASNEILIKYSVQENYQPYGVDILSEHKKVVTLVNKLSSIEILEYEAVGSYIINKMIEENKSEAEIRSENQGRKNRSIFKNNFSSYNTSRIILLKIQEDASGDLLNKIEKIKNSSQLFSANGIEISLVEPNYISQISAWTNDPYYYKQWSYVNTNAELGWGIETGSPNIKIGVIDTGVDIKHEDLHENIDNSLQYDFVNIDTNGYKAMNYKLIIGEDYAEKDSLAEDYHGHGTHCAGIIGAKGNNAIGICGVSHNISIVPLRAGFSIKDPFNQELGLLENDDIINAIDYAVLNGVHILSMSFGGPEYSEIFDNAIQNAANNNMVLIASAGNSSTQSKAYPAAYDNVIAVAASDYNDKKAPFSNFGLWVDVCAPGVNIYSTVPKAGGVLHDLTGYRYLSGTSMAAPFVAGLAGLILSKNSEVTPGALKYILQNSVDLPKGEALYYGTGRVNVYKTLLLNISEIPELVAEISNISENEIIRIPTDLWGSASGDEYKIYLGKGAYPESWSLIDSGTTVNNGYLGTLDISDIPGGQYTLRIVTEKDGYEIESINFIRIAKDENLKPGFPIKITDNNTSSAYFLVDNLDYDGKKEILVASVYDNLVHVYNYDGSPLIGWPVSLPQGGWPVTKPAIYDFYNDGKKEIVILERLENSLNNYVCIYDINGKMLKGWPKPLPGSNIISGIRNSISIDDLNGDDEIEIIILNTVNEYSEIFVYNIEGDLLPNWPYRIEGGYIARSRPVIADIDNDNQKEIVLTEFYQSDPNNVPNYVVAIGVDGKKKENFNYKLNGWGWTNAGGDINNDGIIEIITQDGPIDSEGNKLSWGQSNTRIYSDIAMGNINSDPQLEIVYGDVNLGTYLTDYQGNVLTGWPIFKDKYSADGSHIIADINGDGEQEIVILYMPNTVSTVGQKPGLNVYDKHGKMIVGFPKYEGVYYFEYVTVDDIDNDGFTDIIGYDSQEHEIIAMDFGTNHGYGNHEWGTFLHDNRNTNNYNSTNKDVIAFKIKDIEINEDEYTSLRFSPAKLDWDHYNVKTITGNSSVELITSKGVVNIIPKPNWNGSAEISIYISNENQIDSSLFNLTVLPVNDPPTPFRLLFPSDSMEIIIDNSSINSEITFGWENSNDVDADSLWYGISFLNILEFMNRDSISDFSTTYSVRVISDYLSSENISEANVEWEVFCYDETDTVRSINKLNLKMKRLITTGIENENQEIPNEIFISQNYPNPFNPVTKINFGLNKGSFVSLKIYNIVGELVTILVNREMKAGYHTVNFNAGSFPSGVYIYEMRTEGFVKSVKMVLLK